MENISKVSPSGGLGKATKKAQTGVTSPHRPDPDGLGCRQKDKLKVGQEHQPKRNHVILDEVEEEVDVEEGSGQSVHKLTGNAGQPRSKGDPNG